MRFASAKARGIYVPPEEVEAYLANGWSVVDHLNPHHVLMLPPTPDSDKGGVSAETPPKNGARSWR
jgi:hypothetical protein